jgi:hypothetical protein
MSPEECVNLFDANYPATLQNILDTPTHGVVIRLSMAFVKGTEIVRYNDKYDKYLKLVKYAPLNTFQGDSVYKCSLIGFSKYDNLSRSEVRCSMFHPDKAAMVETMKHMGRLSTPLKTDFTIQLPIQYMMTLMNTFSREDLPTLYESSMKNIIDTGLSYNDFILPEGSGEEETTRINNAIDAYKVRISEANNELMNAVKLLLGAADENDIDISWVFSLLPSIYPAKATITVGTDNEAKFSAVSEPVLREMFDKMYQMTNGVAADISGMK